MSTERSAPKIKVCHVAMGDLWAGAEVQLLALVENLVRQPDLAVSVVLFNESRLAVELRELGIPVAIFPERQWNRIRILRELVAYCRTGQFDVVHTHKYKDTILGTIAAACTGVPVVVRTMHGLPEPFRGMRAIRMWLNESCDQVANRLGVQCVIAVSSQIEEALKDQLGRAKVVQIHNGIALNRLRPPTPASETRKRLGLSSSARIIGTVGRLTAVKGHAHFLLAAKQLLDDHPDLCFLVVGDGPLLASLKDQARQLGLNAQVTFLGHREDTVDLMHVMDIFVLPSLHEGIPMVILEALALARPVVASQIGGIPEVIVPNVHGLLTAVGDSAELARACKRFLDDPLFAERCGRAGQLRVAQEFSSESMGAKVATLYRELVSAKV